jgi:hypothetical protein
MTGQAACLNGKEAPEMTSCAAICKKSYPEYHAKFPFSANRNSWKIWLPPETVLMLPVFFSHARRALFLVTLSASIFDRFSIVVATISPRFGKAMTHSPHRKERPNPNFLHVGRRSARHAPLGMGLSME